MDGERNPIDAGPLFSMVYFGDIFQLDDDLIAQKTSPLIIPLYTKFRLFQSGRGKDFPEFIFRKSCYVTDGVELDSFHVHGFCHVYSFF